MTTDKPEPATLPTPSLDPAVAVVVQLATTEIQVIWRRYAGFLVLHGFIIHGLSPLPADPRVAIGIATAGLISCGLWYVLNFCGWLNQNMYLASAYRLMPERLRAEIPGAATVVLATTPQLELHAPTAGGISKPTGTIYGLAQLTPLLASVAYGVTAVGMTARHMQTWWAPSVAAVAVLSALLIAGFFAVTHYEYKRRTQNAERKLT